jgi:hypothetical protein
MINDKLIGLESQIFLDAKLTKQDTAIRKSGAVRLICVRVNDSMNVMIIRTLALKRC